LTRKPVNALGITRYPSATSDFAEKFLGGRLLSINVVFDNRTGGVNGIGVANFRSAVAVVQASLGVVDPTKLSNLARYVGTTSQVGKCSHRRKIGPEFIAGQFSDPSVSQLPGTTLILSSQGYTGTVRVEEVFELVGFPDDLEVTP
jgi:hypothetical protein